MASADTTDDEFDALRQRLHGAVVRPDDERYDEARQVWNAMFDKFPAAIAECTGAADVVAAVEFARENDLPLSIRTSGHDMKGTSVVDDGLVVDLSRMDGVRVDPDEMTAYVEGGATWGKFHHEMLAFDRITTTLGEPGVGVAGGTLGGGVGPLDRLCGLVVDNLAAADVVTADGELVRASEAENPDLFWALRGGGGNFGVVTSMEFDLYEAGDEVLQGSLVHPFEDAAEVLKGYRDFMLDAPDEVQGKAAIARYPDHPEVPAPLRGETAVMLTPFYVGPVQEGRDVLAPLLAVGDPIFDQVFPVTPGDVREQSDELHQPGRRNYWKSLFLESLPDEAIDRFVEAADPIPTTSTKLTFVPLGGAIAEVDSDATAFPHRDAPFMFGVYPQWSDPDDDEEIMAWTDDLHEVMADYSTGGEYLNNQTEKSAAKARAAYGDNFDRLAEVKAEWDPDNVFRLNQNVEPSA